MSSRLFVGLFLAVSFVWSARGFAGGQQTAIPSQSSPDAQELMNQVPYAFADRNLDGARDLLAQVERLNPKQAKLWTYYGYIAVVSGNLDQAIADYQKEIQFHPDEIPAYRLLGQALMRSGRRDEAIGAWGVASAAEPKDRIAALEVATLMLQARRYTEIPQVLEGPIAALPNDYSLQALRARAWIRGGKKDEGLAEAKKIVAASSDPHVLNDLAYCLADTDTAVDVASEWATRALTRTEQDTASASLANVGRKDIAAVNLLAAVWDTVGWVYFKQGDITAAKRYVNAAWQLNQDAEVADHLGQIFDRQGKHDAAIHMWRLALASDSKYEAAGERLRNAAIPAVGTASTGHVISDADELRRLRSIPVPGLENRTGNADFYLILSREGIGDVQLIGTSAGFSDAAQTIRSTKYEFPFPDEGPEKIVRSGTLYCSTDTEPNCQLTMVRLSSTPVSPSSSRSTSKVLPPTLRSKVEPAYTEAAKKAGLEGTVLLGIVVNEEGLPEAVSVIHGLGMGLDESAEDCVRKWRFNPATKDGKPVKSMAKVEVNFVLVKSPDQ